MLLYFKYQYLFLHVFKILSVYMHFTSCFLHLCLYLSCLCFFFLFGGCWLGLGFFGGCCFFGGGGGGFGFYVFLWFFFFFYFVVGDQGGVLSFTFQSPHEDATSRAAGLIWSYFCGFCCLCKLQEKPWRRNKPPELPPNHPATPAGWGNLKRQWAIWSTADHSRFRKPSRILLVEGVVWIRQKHDPQKASLHTLETGKWGVPVASLNPVHLAGTGQPGDPKESLWI